MQQLCSSVHGLHIHPTQTLKTALKEVNNLFEECSKMNVLSHLLRAGEWPCGMPSHMTLLSLAHDGASTPIGELRWHVFDDTLSPVPRLCPSVHGAACSGDMRRMAAGSQHVHL